MDEHESLMKPIDRSNPNHVDSYQNCLRRAILQLEHDYYEIEPTQVRWKVRAVVIETESDEDGDKAFRVIEYGDTPIVTMSRYGPILKPYQEGKKELDNSGHAI